MRWTEEQLEAYFKREEVKARAAATLARQTGGLSPKIIRAFEQFPPVGGTLPEDATEDDEQIALFAWAALMGRVWPELRRLYHVPNGGSRNKAEAGKLAAMGVKPGVPDICLPVARGPWHGLYIELKRARGGRLSPTQREWLDELTMSGYRAVMCHGWIAAKDEIVRYLKGGPRNEDM